MVLANLTIVILSLASPSPSVQSVVSTILRSSGTCLTLAILNPCTQEECLPYAQVHKRWGIEEVLPLYNLRPPNSSAFLKRISSLAQSYHSCTQRILCRLCSCPIQDLTLSHLPICIIFDGVGSGPADTRRPGQE
jgi:hypothetical protein